MMYSLTIFQNIFDNKAHRKMSFSSWSEFESLLYKLSKEHGSKPKKGESVKDSSPLITPAIFRDGTTRKNNNVLEWSGWCCLDVDSYEGTFEDVIGKFKEFKYCCYSTASSTKTNPRFRVVIPLTSSVSSDKIRHFWFALNKEFHALGDPQTKDLSRMFYIPFCPDPYTDSYQFIFSNNNDAPFLNPHELMSKHPFSDGVKKSNFSAAMQEKMVAYKKEKLTNTSYRWTGYADCPFVNKTLINEYRVISETGWYSKMFTILCSIAASAMKRGYPISSHEIAMLAKELDAETGNWYKNRPMELEAERAIAWAIEA